MLRILNPRIHGILDYLYIPVLLLAPSVLGFGGAAATLCYVLGIAHAGLTILTDYPLGIAKLIPFPVHGGIEILAALLLLAGPWLFGFADDLVARNFFLVSGGLLAVVWLITDYRSSVARAESGEPVAGRRRYA